MTVLGFDTSNYTTSVAIFDGASGENQSRLLPVKAGALGLRQADALFAHVKSLPALTGGLFSHVDPGSVAAVGVSTRPRAVEGSYMPCFLAGVCLAQTVAALLKVPLVEVSHQQGHLAAALWSAGRQELFASPFLAWHLSGGTTELLYTQPHGWNLDCSRIGGTTDISAGQLIDRTGQLLELPFPAGKGVILAFQARVALRCLESKPGSGGIPPQGQEGALPPHLGHTVGKFRGDTQGSAGGAEQQRLPLGSGRPCGEHPLGRAPQRLVTVGFQRRSLFHPAPQLGRVLPGCLLLLGRKRPF